MRLMGLPVRNNPVMGAGSVPTGQRRPLTGIVSIEWVDGADPTDASVPPNFGWFSLKSEPPLDDARLVLLLREVADTVEGNLHGGAADQDG
jgi:hypothetical protein